MEDARTHRKNHKTGKGEETSRDETEDTPEEEKNYDVKLSKNLYDFEFAIMIRFSFAAGTG